jgi:hypothetical protein
MIASPVTQGNETCHVGCRMLPCAGKHSHAAWGVAGIPAKAYIEIRAVLGPTEKNSDKDRHTASTMFYK